MRTLRTETPPTQALREALHRARRRTRTNVREWRRTLQPTDDADVLVESPVFLLSSIRSGSTLLRMVLDSHSAICAPHELHLGSVKIDLPSRTAKPAMREIGLDADRMAFMLWDRVLLRELVRSGKSVIVDKTPKNTHRWRHIHRFWPDARYIFLLRHPVRIAESMIAARPDVDVEKHYDNVLGYVERLNEARQALRGLTVRYEDFTGDPEGGARSLCAFLDVPFEPKMLQYGERERRIRRGLGDWSPAIKSGTIRPAPPPPGADEIPERLLPACRLLGYL